MADAMELTGETTSKWFGRRDTSMICKAILSDWNIPKLKGTTSFNGAER